MRIHEFKCSICGQDKRHKSDITTGYATNQLTNEKICFDCCAEQDRAFMREQGKIMLYLSKNSENDWQVTNWPGTLRFNVTGMRTGRHNMAGSRCDVWFNFNGRVWWGYCVGEMTQVCHCKQTKQVA